MMAFYDQFGHMPLRAQGFDSDSEVYLDIVEQQTKNKDENKPGFYDGLPPHACG
jgi:hypothetical protein